MSVHTASGERVYIGAAAHPDALLAALVDAAKVGKPLRVFADSEAIGTWPLLLLITGMAAGLDLTARFELLLPGPRAVDVFLAGCAATTGSHGCDVGSPVCTASASVPVPPAGTDAPTVGETSMGCDTGSVFDSCEGDQL